MYQINVKDLSHNPNNARIEVVEPPPETLRRAGSQGFEIIDGFMRATALADLGRLVPAINVSTGARVMLKRDHAGQRMTVTPKDAEKATKRAAKPVGRRAKRMAFYARRRSASSISRENWIAAAKQVYLAAGDTEAEADELAKYLCDQDEWVGGVEVQDPCEAAKDDISGRPSVEAVQCDDCGATHAPGQNTLCAN